MSPFSEAENLRRARHRRFIIAGLAVLVVALIGIEIAIQGNVDAARLGPDTVLLHAITVISIVLVLVLA